MDYPETVYHQGKSFSFPILWWRLLRMTSSFRLSWQGITGIQRNISVCITSAVPAHSLSTLYPMKYDENVRPPYIYVCVCVGSVNNNSNVCMYALFHAVVLMPRSNFFKIFTKDTLLGPRSGGLLWIQHLIDIVFVFVQSFMQYLTILDRVITALNGICFPFDIHVYIILVICDIIDIILPTEITWNNTRAWWCMGNHIYT